MKKTVIGIIAILCIFGNIHVLSAYEKSIVRVVEIEKIFGDRSYIETTIEQSQIDSRASSTKGSKTSTYKDSTGKVLWSIKLSGTFTYTGKTATATSSSISTTCPAGNWKLSNKKAYRSGASAYASATAKQYTAAGICTNTVARTLKITCSANGKLS